MMKAVYKAAALFVCILMLCVSCESAPKQKNTLINAVPRYDFEGQEKTDGFKTQIYTIKGDELVGSPSTIELFNECTPIEAIIESLLSQKSLKDYIPEGISLSDAKISYEVCIINLAGTFPKNIEKWLNLEAVISPTLYDFCGVKTICLFMNGSVPVYKGATVGAARYSNLTLEEYVSRRLESLKSNQEKSEYGESVNGDTVYFMPVNDAEYIKAVSADGKLISSGDSRKKRINSLMRTYAHDFTSAYNKIKDSSLKSCFSYKLINEDEMMSEIGIVSLNVKPVESLNISNSILANSIGFTVMCNIPNLIQVNVTIDGEEYQVMYTNAIKLLATNYDVLYPMRDESTLEKKEIVIPSDDRYDVGAILLHMLDEKSTDGTLFPNYLMSKMKLVNKSGDTILLEITEDARAEVLHNFINSYEHYDSPETRERLFIYSIVNTLTQIPNVDSVLFVNEKGKAAQSFININLGMPLYPNPGLEAD